ncbi:hypothetical protein [Streptomyces roseolus]|uniref:hypothetical protein n=1 Tax=Streptomyces roseolus TaxID=67358 RepID=UPI00365FF73C
MTALVRAADEAARRRLRFVVAVPPVHDRRGYDALGHRSALRTRIAPARQAAELLAESSVIVPLTARAPCPDSSSGRRNTARSIRRRSW